MSTPKQSRRKIGAKKLEPIDWHEFANDAVLNGNMSTLYNRPPSEDSTAYASPEALVEIDKRLVAFGSSGLEKPTVGIRPTVGSVSGRPVLVPDSSVIPTVGMEPTVGMKPTVGTQPVLLTVQDTFTLPVAVVDANANIPTAGPVPTVGMRPTVGMDAKRSGKPIRDVQDALTLAGQVLYKTMYGAPDGAKSKSCTKGYRQLAAETHLDKDTVRDLISEFKEKGIVRETRTYDPDTRSAKTYEVLSYKAILQIWRDADLVFVTTGRQRPMFCTAQGELIALRSMGSEPIVPNNTSEPRLKTPTVGLVPTVGIEPTAGLTPTVGFKPTVGMEPTVGLVPTVGEPTVGLEPTAGPLATSGRSEVVEGERQQATTAAAVIQALQQITGNPVDQEAADRLIRNCLTEAADCTIEEIVEFAWSKAFLCRSGKIENPIGLLITQVPKHFKGDALQAYRENKRKALESAAALATCEEQRRQELEREIVEMEERHRVRSQMAERHRIEQGIDLKGLLQDSEADDVLKDWAKRMLKFGYRHRPHYD